MRSNRSSSNIAIEKSQDPLFVDKMRNLFASEPHGILELMTFQQVVERLKKLEERVWVLENVLGK